MLVTPNSSHIWAARDPSCSWSRIFVATWNVGGRSPPNTMSLEDWLHAAPPADIYVLGYLFLFHLAYLNSCQISQLCWFDFSDNFDVVVLFRFQEIVPLNAGNVLGTEDNGPARRWVSLVRRTLNNLPGTSGNGSFRTPSPAPDPVVEMDDDFEGLSSRQNNASFFHRRSFQAGLSRSLRMEGDILAPQPRLERRYSVCDRAIYGRRPSDYEATCRWGGSSDDENNTGESPSTVYSPMSYGYGNPSSLEESHRPAGHTR